MSSILGSDKTSKTNKIISVNLWKTGKIPEVWIKKKSISRKKGDSGSYNLATLSYSCSVHWV